MAQMWNLNLSSEQLKPKPKDKPNDFMDLLSSFNKVWYKSNPENETLTS